MKKTLVSSVSVCERVCPGNIVPRTVRDLRRVFGQFRRAAAMAGAVALVMPLATFAQTSAVLPRITVQINESNLTTLRGNTHPLARPQYDQGAVADSQPIRRMLLLLQRSPEQETALRTLIDQQQSKASPNYHQWLTPQQFGQQFGPATADIQSVTGWLQSHGFQVARVSTGGTLIEFSGTAGQVLNAFHTQIHRYVVNGEEHFANSTDPQIPSAIASVVAGPVSLNSFPHKPLSKVLGLTRKSKETGQITPLYSFSGCQSITGAGSNCNGVGPGDFAAIYNISKLWKTGINGHLIDGTGQTIAVVGDSEICTASSPDWQTSYIGPFGSSVTCSSDDVAQFRSLFGLPVNAPNVVVDGPDPGFNSDETEGDLDVEWSGAVAKNATIDFVIAEDTEATFGGDLAAEYVVDNNLAPVMSESFGACEAALQSGGNYFEATLWEQAAAQGITVIVSAGDGGSAGCDNPDTQSAAGQNPNTAFGPAVNGIASTPFNVAAGGTDFDITASNYETLYWGGPSTQASGYVSALSYIPETTWNDSCEQNFTGAFTGCTPGIGGILAGGGGQSNCAATDNLGNCYYYPKPSWQTLASGSGITSASDLARDLPDISLFSAVGYKSNSFYIVCESDLDETGSGCNLNTAFIDFVPVGGTSSAAPTFAGIMALVNQNMVVNHSTPAGQGQGNANYALYDLAKAQTTAELNCNSSSTSISALCTFNDITKGNNSVPCVGGTPGCSNLSISANQYGALETVNVNTGAPTATPDFVAWNTATGLDLASGLGSVNAYNLVNNWASATFTPTTTTLCLSTSETALATCSNPISINHGQTVYVNTQVSANGNPIPVTEALPTATLTDPYVPSVAEDVALIGTFPSGNPSCSVTGCTTGGVDHFTSNGYVISNYDIYPLTSGTTVGKNYFTQDLTGGSYNVAAHYTGDGTYGGSTSSPITVTVNPEGSTAAPCVIVANPFTEAVEGGVSFNPNVTPPLYSCSSVTSAYYGDLIFLRADVIGTSSGQESATGTATLYDNGVAGVVNPTGGVTSTYSLNSEGYLEDQTPFLAVGSHSLQVKYNGDASYMATTALSGAAALTVAAAPTTTQITSPSSGGTIQSGQSVTLTAFVDTAYSASTNFSGGSLGYPPTGTVTFMTSTGTMIGSPLSLTAATDSTGYVAGTATMSYTPSATVTVTAVYTPALVSGVANYVSSCAGASPCSFQGVLINAGTAGVNASPGCGSATINISSPGGTGTCVITVSGVNSFAGTVALGYSLSGTPSGAVDLPTCTFGTPGQNFTAPGTITLSTSSETGSATMTCITTGSSVAVFRPLNRPPVRGWPLAGVGIALFSFFFLLAIPRQRRWGLVPLAALLFVVVTAGVSCGGGSSSGGGGVTNPGTTTGSYTLTVTATPAGGSASTTTVTLNVQ